MAEGYQVGSKGRSYAIRTVVRPGGPVVPMAEIEAQFIRLWCFAQEHPELTFLLTEVGSGLAGHRRTDLRAMIDQVIHQDGLAGNIKHTDEVYR